MKLLSILGFLAVSWQPAAPQHAVKPAPDLAEYVYLHVTRGEVAPAALSCPGRIQAVRS